jgi:hypothetical protein
LEKLSFLAACWPLVEIVTSDPVGSLDNFGKPMATLFSEKGEQVVDAIKSPTCLPRWSTSFAKPLHQASTQRTAQNSPPRVASAGKPRK